ncbi:MAG: imidazole glycerol phosphate synthase cyclase subunit [Candidatus Diapherotrites archaeon]|nr:imidazole glycerol phosphate synthase cyclase subunit [Candidatus Diapherotrites archaeon]
MLKKRLIACILMQNGLVVQSINFKKFHIVGRAETAVEFFNNWDVDEIIFLDINATREGRGSMLDVISKAAKKSFIPLTVGGGIRKVVDITSALNAGADKVCVNSEALLRHGFITEAADVFGSQCIVVSIDAKLNKDGKHEVFYDGGTKAAGKSPLQWAKQAELLGAGEIFLNSIDRDGSKQGYDLDLIRQVRDAVSIPVIACGGVGKVQDFAPGIIKGHADAVAAANIFQYFEHSTILAKAALLKAGVDVRMATEATYMNSKV